MRPSSRGSHRSRLAQHGGWIRSGSYWRATIWTVEADALPLLLPRSFELVQAGTVEDVGTNSEHQALPRIATSAAATDDVAGARVAVVGQGILQANGALAVDRRACLNKQDG